MRDHDTSSAIIGRWGLPWNLLSEQLRSKNEGSRAQSSLSDVQWTVHLKAIMGSLCCWTVHGYGNTLRSIGAAAARAHMTCKNIGGFKFGGSVRNHHTYACKYETSAGFNLAVAS